MQTGEARSAFFMTEPAEEQGAGSDPSMLKTTARRDGDAWVIDGSKTFITGAVGAAVGIVMALTKDGDKPRATMFLVDLPDPAIEVVKVLDTIDGSMPGGHARIAIRACGYRRTRCWAKCTQDSNMLRYAFRPRGSRIVCAGSVWRYGLRNSPSTMLASGTHSGSG
ncbi:hypothetical protein NK8_83970 (plasmid) [Caballeronia sp. NK8]|nr:hypothetical protein NK8_83970 [Caballeronia sp. NK8]